MSNMEKYQRKKPSQLKLPQKRKFFTNSSDSSDEEMPAKTIITTKNNKNSATKSTVSDMKITNKEATKFVTGADGKELVLFKTGYSPLSNFYPLASFEIDGEEYGSVVQWIEAKKAKFCGDKETLDAIMSTKAPSYATILGKKLTPEKEWYKQLYAITEQGIKEKFKQNQDLKQLLLETGSATIAEARKTKPFWTIGLDINDVNALNQENWCGKNMMGKILMKIRDTM